MLRTRGIRLLGAVALAMVVGASPAFAANIIPNGSFEDTAFHDFYSAYKEVTTSGPEALWAEGTYALGGDPFSYHKYWASYSPYKGRTMMIVNGATGENIEVWSSTVEVADNTNYYFSAWVASSYSESPAVLRFSINDAPLGLAFTASPTTGDWQRFYATWNSGTSGVARLSLLNMNTTASGNDFTLDDIALDTERPTGIETTVPEPASLILLGTGLLGAGRAWRKRRQ